MAFKMQADFDRQEALQYRAGQRVELKQRPGVVYTIAEYDPMMVPPIWLTNDPQPRYPEELNAIPTQVMDWFRPQLRGRVQYSVCRLNDRSKEKALV
ncbi:hypothetical protein [Aerosakkonema funiforme]|uniref:hypothetical protein n=1 Tax=Aerosakkonema funiforme TaxID=1246630 RepID=UPI0035B8D881